ncbi:MAG: twin-arginine translocation pathway signal [Rhodobacterales bacterium]|nr:MAG: twin-arginine translocation pathway signal [Rhodobacterales bacterium]
MPAGNSRRGFLAGLLAATALPSLSWADAGSPAYLAAARDRVGGFEMVGLDRAGRDLFTIPLPGRGHAACGHPSAPEAVAFARRPGTYALVINCVTGQISAHLQAPNGHHFTGHGVFLSDGDTLCTPENDFNAERGVIGFWSRKAGYRRVGQIRSGGVGPHELRKLAGSDVLVVANGGILTHPDRGREKLNLDVMQPNLTYLDVQNGVLEVVTLAPELHQNSIRHLDIHPDGTVAFAMQWQGAPGEAHPLLGLHKRGQGVRLLSAPLARQMGMKGYAGSVSYNRAGTQLAITSPRGGQVHFYQSNGDYIGHWQRRDVCGLRDLGDGFLASDGNGALHKITPQTARPLSLSPRSWDNHIVSIAV